jgi:hypothetical protein
LIEATTTSELEGLSWETRTWPSKAGALPALEALLARGLLRVLRLLARPVVRLELAAPAPLVTAVRVVDSSSASAFSR